MARSEFRWNKKRKHYAYLFKDKGNYRKCILIHSDPGKKSNWTVEKEIIYKKTHTRLFRHPNPNKNNGETFFVENRIYTDHKDSFDLKTYHWQWDKNDKRKIKRIKKGRRTR